MLRPSKPAALALALALLAAPLAPLSAAAQEPEWRHGLSLFGSLKYPPDFKNFDYVNAAAPKGGVVRFAETGSFDSFNSILPKGVPPAGLGLIYDSLMTSALDEPSTEYGQLAEAVRAPDDYSWATYRLRAEARWHDGKPVTPDDVVWSFKKSTELSPQLGYYYRHVVAAEVTGEREVTFRFDEKGNRELPQIVGQLSVLPKHWWEGTGPDGKPRDITKTTLEPPLGNGAYRIKSFEASKRIVYERVPDYWGANLPTAVGQNNFDEIRWEYFRDEQVELEAFKGDNYDWRTENTAKEWATAYDFPAVRDGRVILEKFAERGSGVGVGFLFNLRRPKFQDPRVRQAFNYLLPFEEMNRTTFFGQYKRIDSYFFGTELAAAKAPPEGAELAILNEAKTKGPVPEEVFTKPYVNPTTGDPNQERANIREALKLFREAGYVIDGSKLVDAKTKEPFRVEFLMNGPNFERVGLRFKDSLSKVGIDFTIRAVDSSQYVNRLRGRDYDMIYTGWGQSLSPGNEQLEYFASESADRDGSRNYAGIKNPAVDYVVRRLIFAKDREELVAATRALDRLLLANHYIVPGWTIKEARTARWNRFSRPETLPYYNEPAFPTVWWYDEAKAAKTGGAR